MEFNGIEIVDRIDNLLKLHGETRAQLALILGRRKQIFSDWKAKNNIPQGDSLYIMSKHFNVSIEYILTGKDSYLPEDIRKANIELAKLTEEQRKPIMAIISGQVDYWYNEYNK